MTAGETDEPLALRLAAWFAGLEWQALPKRQRDLAQLRLLDTIGLILGGFATPAAAIVRQRVGQEGAAGGASLVGSAGKVPAGWAALAHGVAAHCHDYDDTFPDSVVHPGSVIVPVALGMGEELKASGAEILTAIAGGYEIAARLARVGGRGFHQRGFHPSGIFAPIAAAFVAGRLMRLPATASASAVGLAASMSGGLFAFIADGSWSKWLHLGWGGFGGILAAQLAAGGFRGPLGALDGRHNLYAAFLAGTPVSLDDTEDGLGERWLGDTALFKLYPCAHVIQPYIDLALELRRRHGIEAPAVTRIHCAVAPWAVPIVCEPAAEKPNPPTKLEAIASLPYQLASALIDGSVGIETLEPPKLGRAEAAALARRVTYAADPGIAGFGAALEIELRDGRRFAASGEAAAADAARLGQKFRSLAVRALPVADVVRLEDLLERFADAASAAPLGALLRQARAQMPGSASLT
ncbi:MAG TPA: MmgE/PrpD family protein [Stellaceae bacterium]|nr:MmgE/PrpD family protein [Stellaceae bacterium]